MVLSTKFEVRGVNPVEIVAHVANEDEASQAGYIVDMFQPTGQNEHCQPATMKNGEIRRFAEPGLTQQHIVNTLGQIGVTVI